VATPASHDLVVIGASAGGLQALFTILGALPPTLPAAIVVVVHTRSNGGVLPQVLGRRSALPVQNAADDAALEPGRVYVAPADRHVLVAKKGLRVVRGPRENGFRPAVDPLFRTAARSHGPGVIGVILSGALDDGAYGLSAIVRRGGLAIVQDPDDAEVPSMPLAALRLTQVHAVVPSSQIADAIGQFCRQPAGQEVRAMPRPDQPEPQRPADDTQVADMMALNGAPSPITCPACGGALWETEDEGVVRYACHVGHQYAPDSLLAEHGEAVEQALWSAVRVLEQHAELRMRMAKRAQDAGIKMVAEGFAEDSHNYHLQARHIRQLLLGQRDRVAADPAAVRRNAQAR
jgi:two-component system, chemotaxis family, protein-glutamate methylesterase/glutaminase